MSGLDIGVTRGDITLWSHEERAAYIVHQDKYLWWRNNVRIGVYVNVVALFLTIFFWPVFLAVVVGTVMILRGIDSMRGEKAKADHHLFEHHKWESLKEVW